MAKEKKVKAPKINPLNNPGVPEFVKKAQTGFMWVYNRLPTDFSVTFDGKEEAWDPHEYKMVHLNLAKFCERRAIHKWDPLGTRTIMALVDSKHKYFGIPLPQKDVAKGKEILVRNKGLGPTASDVTEVEVPD